MSILNEYTKQWKLTKAGIKNLYDMDGTIISYAINHGYSLEQIKDELKRHSVVLKNKIEPTAEAYFKKIDKIYGKVQPVGHFDKPLSYEALQNKYLERFRDLYKKTELAVAEYLLNLGYKNHEIQNIIKEKSPFFLLSKNEQDKYVNLVMNNLPSRAQDLKFAEYLKQYNDQVSIYKNKNQQIDKYIDGKIACDLYLKEKVPLKYLNRIFSERTANEKAKQPEYAQSLIADLEKVKANYERIYSFSKKQPETDYEKYLLYMKQYLRYQNKKILNGTDEQQIIKRLLAERVDNDKIKCILLDYSPVAIQPGRNTEKYIKNTLDIVEKDYKERVIRAKEHFAKVSKLFDQELINIKAMKQKDELRGKKLSHYFYFGILAKKLLNKGAYAPYIIKNFEEKVPKLKSKLPNSNDTYVYALMNTTQKAVDNEKAIMNFISPYKFYEMELNDIRAKNIPIADVFRQVVKERLDVYPNINLNLSRSFVDEDACIKLLNRYPDIKKEELVQAIKDASVYNKLPGVAPNYPEQIVDSAINKYKEANRFLEDEKQRKAQLKDEFELYKDIETSTEQNNNNNEILEQEQKDYCACRAAVNMIKKQVSEIDVKNIIAEEATETKMAEKAKYSDFIYDCAKKVINRELQIVNYIPLSKVSPENQYKLYMKDVYKQNKFFSQDTDISVAKKMLNDNIDKEDIKISLIKYSPLTAEPRKVKEYVEDVTKRAEIDLAQEKIKLQNYQPMLREEKDPVAAYKHHLEDFQSKIDLPLTKAVDVIIAEAMLMQNISKSKVEDAITTMSSLSPKTENNIANNTYGKEIVKNAERSLYKRKITNTNEQYQGRERELTPFNKEE